MNCRASSESTFVRVVSWTATRSGMAMFFACESLSSAISLETDAISSGSKSTSLSPSAMRSPGCSGSVPSIFAPFSVVPFTLPRSRTIQLPSSKAISA
jgi:hypothetical protein